MIRGLYTAATGMLVENMRTDVIANNLANVQTNGYKRDIGIFKSLPEVPIRRYFDHGVPPLPLAKTVKHLPSDGVYSPKPWRKPPLIGTLGTGAILDEVFVDGGEGTYEHTDRKLDLATPRDRFFVVEHPDNGQILFTKNGAFQVNNEGYLTTTEGFFVLAFNGDQVRDSAPLLMDESGNLSLPLSRMKVGAESALHFDAGGQTYINNQPQGQILARADIKDLRQVRKAGSNAFIHHHGSLNADQGNPLRVGYLEKSNSSVVTEMVELITASRAYESNARVIQTHDGLLDRAVNSLGRLG